MSRREPKAGEWLRQQIDELGALRNASVRDPQFKAWRQNTLTFIQRIWPGDTTKSERFRRVPFTPPSTRHDARTAREYFERGCGEALEYLNTLLAGLDDAPAATATAGSDRHPESFEGDFPEVDLGGGPSTPVGAAPPAALDESPLDLPAAPAARGEGPPELPASAGRPAAPGSSGEFLASAAFLDPEAESPGNLPGSSQGPAATQTPFAPPAPVAAPGKEDANSSRISVRGNPARPVEPAENRVNPLADILGPAREQARKADDLRETPHVRKEAPREATRETTREAPREATREAPKNGKKKGKTQKPRLKDMLGLSSLEQSPVETPVPPAPARADHARETPVPPAPARADHTRETPMTDAAPLDEAPATSPDPAAPAPPETWRDPEIPASDSSPAFAAGLESSGGWSLPEFMTPADSSRVAATPPVEPAESPAVSADASHEALSASHVESLPAPPQPRPEPAASDEDAGHDARVTAEFLDKSPVLSSVPRPATRRRTEPAPSTPPPRAASPEDSTASRVLAIAAEVDQLGVPEGHRARARAALMDLARQLDEQDVAWDVLRDAVHVVMEFPPLARRTLPLLLPYLDRAA